jgi:hypothetical protein
VTTTIVRRGQSYESNQRRGKEEQTQTVDEKGANREEKEEETR